MKPKQPSLFDAVPQLGQPTLRARLGLAPVECEAQGHRWYRLADRDECERSGCDAVRLL